MLTMWLIVLVIGAINLFLDAICEALSPLEAYIYQPIYYTYVLEYFPRNLVLPVLWDNPNWIVFTFIALYMIF